MKKNNRISKGYYIWGRLEETDKDELENIKHKVNVELKGPPFDIHITLSGPLAGFSKKLISVNLETISRNFQRFNITPLCYVAKDKFYESLHIGVLNSKDLQDLVSYLNNTFNIYSENFYPHISLFYGDCLHTSKLRIIESLPKLPKHLLLNSISLVYVNENIDLWEIQENFYLQ